MSFVFFRASVLVSLVACGDVATMVQPTPNTTHDAAVERDASSPEVSDAGVDVREAATATDAACVSSPYTQVLCYGTSRTDAGTSQTYPTDCDTQGCELRIDEAGANPPVWCCH